MPASAIDRLSNNTGHNGVFSGPVVTGTLPNRRNQAMERLSRNARRLRGGIGAGGVPDLAKVGRNDSLEQLTVRLGAIPILYAPSATSLTAYLQAMPGRRPAATETISVTGPTAPQVYAVGGPGVAPAFAAGGTGQVVAATDSVDAAAKGRALVDVLP